MIKINKVLKVREELLCLADESYLKFNSSLTPTNYSMIGVRVPLIEKLAKSVDFRCFIEFLKEKPFYYEEVLLYGFVLANEKLDIEQKWYYFSKLIMFFDNWAHVDIVTSRMKVFKKHLPFVLDKIITLMSSSEEFVLRSIAVILLDYFLTDDYIDKAIELLCSIKRGQYYVDMAIAWGLSVALVKYFEKTVVVLENNVLDKFTHNKTISKACDSLRVSYEIKKRLKNIIRYAKGCID